VHKYDIKTPMEQLVLLYLFVSLASEYIDTELP